MTRKTVMKIVILLAIAAVAIVGFNMLSGRAATVPQ